VVSVFLPVAALLPEPLFDWPEDGVAAAGGSAWPWPWPRPLPFDAVGVCVGVVTGVALGGAGPVSRTGCSSCGLVVGRSTRVVSLVPEAGGVAAVAPVSLDFAGWAGVEGVVAGGAGVVTGSVVGSALPEAAGAGLGAGLGFGLVTGCGTVAAAGAGRARARP
jgi:hypothetical protein